MYRKNRFRHGWGVGGKEKLCPLEIKIVISLKINIRFTPNWKFKFVCCLKLYGPWMDPGGPFFTKCPPKSALKGPFMGKKFIIILLLCFLKAPDFISKFLKTMG